jgi:microcystin-dependent protein
MNFGAHQKPTVGDTKTALINEDHLGWIKCDGRLLSPSEYQNLYKVIGYSFGRAGPLFRLPDPAGRVMGMIGSANPTNTDVPQNLTARYMGGLSGEETHTLTIPEMPIHTHVIDFSGTGIYLDPSGEHVHTITDPGHHHSYTRVNETSASATVGDHYYMSTTSDSTGNAYTGISVNSNGLHNHELHDPTHNHDAENEGGDLPHNNIQPTLWLGNLFIYSGKTGFNRGGTYSGAFPNTTGTNVY